MIGPIDSIEFRMTSNTAEHLAQLQYRASQYNYCLGTRSNASSYYDLHSLRSGGITAAVRNSRTSIPERLFKIHGRWRSDSAKDMYVAESLENRLHVTKYLGL